MLLRCPSCGESFEIADAAIAVKATHPCAHCHRIVVIRDAHVIPPGGESTVPFEDGKPVASRAADVATRISGTSLPDGQRASLAFLNGPRGGEVVALRVPRFVIGGKGGGADLEVDDTEVSKEHAALEYGGGRFELRDLGSQTGTWMGEDRVESRILADRDEFRLGGIRFVLILSG